MTSLLNTQRPPVFCPGCSHERVVTSLDKALDNRGLQGHQLVIVSDIGCSGLFDTFFNAHAFHGLHGRALTYATGLKMARPDLKVVVTMGDGGLGIGGAHVLATCRRNIDLTLLVLNNFNYGMTGGQCSATTPSEAQVGSGFLNRLEKPVDICTLAGAAGAPYLARLSAYQKDLSEQIGAAVDYAGFSVVDIWGVCPGRYTKHNQLTPKRIDERLADLPAVNGPVSENQRSEYSHAYAELAARQIDSDALTHIPAQFQAPQSGRREVVILGGAGQRIVTAGELLCLAGISAGLHVTQKNDYPITVLRGHSVSELVLDAREIGFTGIDRPDVVLALSPEGVARRPAMWPRLSSDAMVIAAKGVSLPHCNAHVEVLDFKAGKIKSADWALAALAVMAARGRVLTQEMLAAAVRHRFSGKVRDLALATIARATALTAEG
ncbi:MAG: thiamine pyrophosphate-dependent enzyme [Desulfosarcinaceae bacterium]|nr:thiamine pyrophosphate-dependent enzyme [Desulfosarcinaceae bacterium]